MFKFIEINSTLLEILMNEKILLLTCMINTYNTSSNILSELQLNQTTIYNFLTICLITFLIINPYVSRTHLENILRFSK